MDYEELLMAVGERMHLAETLRPNADGTVTLSDGEYTFVISCDTERTYIEIVGEVGSLPAGGREGCLRMLLEANFRFSGTKGGTLSQQPDGDLVLLGRKERLSGLTPEALHPILQDFVDSLAEWRGTLAEYCRIGPAIDEARAEDASALRAGGEMFLRA